MKRLKKFAPATIFKLLPRWFERRVNDAAKYASRNRFSIFLRKKTSKNAKNDETRKTPKMTYFRHFRHVLFFSSVFRILKIRPFWATKKMFFFRGLRVPVSVYRRSGAKMTVFSKTSPIYILFKYARHPPPSRVLGYAQIVASQQSRIPRVSRRDSVGRIINKN